MPWVKVTIRCICRYFDYLWALWKSKWRSRNNTGIFGLISGFFKSFVEAFVLTRIDIREGYLS